MIERKLAGPEKGVLELAERALHAAEYARLVEELGAAAERSRLPEEPTARRELDELLVRLRLGR